MIQNSYLYHAYSELNESLFDIKVVSCGHIFAKKDRHISRPAGREDWLLFYVARGVEHFYLDTEVNAGEGSFIIFKPSEPQEHIYVGEKTGEFYFLHFTAPKDFDLFGLQSSVVYNTVGSLDVKALFEEIIKELQAKEAFYEKICISKFFHLLCFLERKTTVNDGKKQKQSYEIYSVIQMINKDYNSKCTLDEYAEMSRMSKFHFLRRFKEITGSSPLKYRAKIRLEHAAELLSDTDMSIGEISSSLGFNSQNYFCDAFKNHFGISPNAYRSQREK